MTTSGETRPGIPWPQIMTIRFWHHRCDQRWSHAEEISAVFVAMLASVDRPVGLATGEGASHDGSSVLVSWLAGCLANGSSSACGSGRRVARRQDTRHTGEPVRTFRRVLMTLDPWSRREQ